MALRRLVGSALSDESIDTLRKTHGPPHELIKAASRPRPDVLEIYRTYKAKWRKFVLKQNALRTPQDTDVMKRTYFRERVTAIFEPQEQECRARVRRAEASDG